MFVRKVNIHEAKTTLSQLVEAAEAGEKVVLARSGKAVVEIVRLKKKRGIRLGTLKGQLDEKSIEQIIKPLSKRDSARLFGGMLGP